MFRAVITTSVCLVALAGPLVAQVDCGVVFSLERVQAARVRLAASGPRDQPDILAYLAAELRRLDTANAGFALRDLPGTDRDKLLGFLDDTHSLMAAATTPGQLATAISAPDASQRAAVAGLLLGRLDCDNPAPGTEAGANSRVLGPSEALRPSRTVSLTSGFVGALALVLCCYAGWWSLGSLIRRQDRREEAGHRFPTCTATSLRLGDEAHQITVVDISRRGAKLKLNSPAPLTVPQTAALQINGRWVMGAIRWSNSFFAGMQFNAELSPAALAAFLANDPAHHQSHYGTPRPGVPPCAGAKPATVASNASGTPKGAANVGHIRP